jgi:hypothetical protein
VTYVHDLQEQLASKDKLIVDLKEQLERVRDQLRRTEHMVLWTHPNPNVVLPRQQDETEEAS